MILALACLARLHFGDETVDECLHRGNVVKAIFDLQAEEASNNDAVCAMLPEVLNLWHFTDPEPDNDRLSGYLTQTLNTCKSFRLKMLIGASGSESTDHIGKCG